MFKTLAKEKINIDLISSSEVRITCVIDEKRTADAIRTLHKEFRLERIQRGLARVRAAAS
jgi:aspartate kinase